jgi:lipoate-protein ligase A
MSEWRWIPSRTAGPAGNMAVDEALLRADPVVPTFRAYRWEPHTVSLGYFQEVDREAVARHTAGGLGLVRRPTGGKAICHADELTYCLVWPAGESRLPRNAEEAYRTVHGAFVRAFSKLGVQAEFRAESRLESDTGAEDEFWCFYESTSFDLVLGGRKLVGSAQRRAGRGFLMHGSIPLGPNGSTPEAAHAGVPFDVLEAELVAALSGELATRFRPGDISEEEQALAKRLSESRYSEDRWTWRGAVRMDVPWNDTPSS